MVIGAAKRIRESDRYETFGTPEKGFEQPSKDIDFDKQMKIDQQDSQKEKDSNITDEEDDSVGYLDNGEGGEEEAEQTLPLSNIATRKRLMQVSPKPDDTSKILISLQSKSPDVRISKRTIKIKSSADGSQATQNSAEKPTVGIKPQLGISSSAKVIDKDKNYIEKSNKSKVSTASKQSLQLSDSCPKENLVRQLYQRPGLLASYDGLNSRLRSMSIRRS